ncbi:unnamed protein product, partial [Mesorhabditis spiculigera]
MQKKRGEGVESSTNEIATSPVTFPPTGLPIAKKLKTLEGLITKSPKRWGTLKECTEPKRRFDIFSLDASTFQLTRRGAEWEPERKYLLAYGDVYSFQRQVKCTERSFDGHRCCHVPPGDDRMKPALEDLYILLNNATFEQFGFGSGWLVPDAEKYEKAPYIRTHNALLAIKGPKAELCRQIAGTKPYCVAVHSNPGEAGGELRSTINDVVMLMPDLKKLWAHFGREICESDCLVDVKMPTIVVYMALMKTVPTESLSYKKYEPDAGLLVQFNHTLVPTLQTIITQWEKREREIDYVVVNTQQPAFGRRCHWRDLDKGFADLPVQLCEGRHDVHHLYGDDRLCMIRREPFSDEGLFITISGDSILLFTCGYNTRRHRSWQQCCDFIRAADEASLRMGKAMKPGADNGIVAAPEVMKYRGETVVQEWVNSEKYNELSTREGLADYMVYGWYPYYYHIIGWPYPPHEVGFRPDPIMCAYADLSEK